MTKSNNTTILFLFISILTFGQTKDSIDLHEWNVGLGYQNFRLLDKNVSPLIYASNNGTLSLEYQNNKTTHLWSIGLATSVGSMQSKRFGRRKAITYDPYDLNGHRDSVVYDINPALSFINTSLYYSRYWQLPTKRIKNHIGFIAKDDFYYGALGADVWFFNQLSIMPVFRAEVFNSSKSTINADISTTLISYLIRQPYALDPSLPENSYLIANIQTGSSIYSINKFQQLNLNLKYRYALKSGSQIGLNYIFMWMNYSNIQNRNLRAYSYSILISYTL